MRELDSVARPQCQLPVARRQRCRIDVHSRLVRGVNREIERERREQNRGERAQQDANTCSPAPRARPGPLRPQCERERRCDQRHSDRTYQEAGQVGRADAAVLSVADVRARVRDHQRARREREERLQRRTHVRCEQCP